MHTKAQARSSTTAARRASTEPGLFQKNIHGLGPGGGGGRLACRREIWGKTLEAGNEICSSLKGTTAPQAD